jgi:pyruvate/2-oxoglutarate dehydrogenase complex dihydrolipoamide acyltransferase (E2) component
MGQLAKRGIRVTVTAVLIKAIALAQKLHPLSRSIILPWGRIVNVPHITAGFTVERIIDGEPVVYFGTIYDPVDKSVEQIASELYEYKTSEIDALPQLAMEDRFTSIPWLLRKTIFLLAKCIPALRFKCFGATFGLSSLGKYGPDWVTGPCVCTTTFGVGVAEEKPVVDNEVVAVKPMLNLTLGFDLRVMDTHSAQKFLLDVRQLVEGGMESELQQA